MDRSSPLHDVKLTSLVIVTIDDVQLFAGECSKPSDECAVFSPIVLN